MTSGMPQGPVGAAVLAARRRLAGISSDAVAKFSESAQRAIDARKKGEQMHQDLGNRVKKIEGRLRETAENRAAGQAGRGPGEIGPGDRGDSSGFPETNEDAEANDSVLEPVTAAPQRSAEPAPVPQRSLAAEDRVPADVLTPPVEGEQSVPRPQDRWQQVQAGRFGRAKQAEPAKPEERKSPAARTGHAQPVSDDDYFDNDGWLS